MSFVLYKLFRLSFICFSSLFFSVEMICESVCLANGIFLPSYFSLAFFALPSFGPASLAQLFEWLMRSQNAQDTEELVFASPVFVYTSALASLFLTYVGFYFLSIP